MSSSTSTTSTTTIDFALAEHNSDSVPDARAMLLSAKYMLRVLDAPDAFSDSDRNVRYSAGYFARFGAAFEGMCATLSAKQQRTLRHLRYLSQEQRATLKAALHEDVKAAADAARALGKITPKQFGGAPLPAEAVQCERRVDTLIDQAEVQMKALKARIVRLDEAKCTLTRMRTNMGFIS